MQFPMTSFEQEKAQAFSELLPDGFVSLGPDARVVYVNERAERITGLSRDSLIGRDVREALELRDRDGSLWWERTDPWRGLNIRSGHREKLLLLANGREVLVTARYLRPGRNQPVRRVLLGLRDAEARQRAEADHAALISTVAHELRSPLTSVKGFSSTLLRRWERFTDDQKRLIIETIEADADRVTRLITELLDVSRIDAGRLAIHPRPVDLRAIFAQHVERAVASGHPREQFAVEVADNLPEVWADPDRLDQILANLIENALRHGRGRVTLAAGNGHDPKSDAAPAADILVSDEGDGIPQPHRMLVFSRFWQGGARGSSGLGLYVVRGLVEAHGGTIGVEDGPGGGALIRVTLPSTPPEHLV
jgi:PAS domain S-box-containing protein